MGIARLVVDFVTALLWPAVAVLVAVKLWPQLKDLLGKSDDLEIQVGGFKLSAQKASEDLTRIIGDVQADVGRLRDELAALELKFARPEHRMAAGTAAIGAKVMEGLSDAVAGRVEELAERERQLGTILWVDDQPENNAFEVAILEKDGAQVDRALSTEEALSLVEGRNRLGLDDIDVVITDMVREEHGKTNYTAGLGLAHNLRLRMVDLPVILYCSRDTLMRLDGSERALGIVAATSSASVLVSLLYLPRLMQLQIGQILEEEAVDYARDAEFGGHRFDIVASLHNSIALPISVKAGRGHKITLTEDEASSLRWETQVGGMPKMVVVTRLSGQILVTRTDAGDEVIPPSDYLDIVGLPQLREYVRTRLEEASSN